MQKIILDTDIGGDIDDALCLAYLLQEPECELLGITTVCGESEKRAAVADAICHAAGREVPIVAGMDRPLQPIPVYPTPEDADALNNWAHAEYEMGDAPEFIYRLLCSHPGEIILIAIGNLTNIAALFQRHPDAPSLLKGISSMNGYFGAEELPEAWYNWNAWADPLAARIVASAAVQQKMISLDVTDKLTIEVKLAQYYLPDESALMRCVYDFGSAWLKDSGKLTLHDPLAAAVVFHPELCTVQRGCVDVETEDSAHMAATSFCPDENGNIDVIRSVNAARFYQLLSGMLCGKECIVPPIVAGRAYAAGEAGMNWLNTLDATVASLRQDWQLQLEDVMSGGSRAYVVNARNGHGEPCVLKVELPDISEEEFMRAVQALRIADGNGYGRMMAVDVSRRAFLLERLGKPLKQSGLPAEAQMRIICKALLDTWRMPVGDADLPDGSSSISWFREYIEDAWKQLNQPCPRRVIDQAMAYIDARERAIAPAGYVLLHGDAHNNNTLESLSEPGSYKLIDPEGLLYEREYDLGVLMREWPEDYRPNLIEKGRARSRFLGELTGVDAQGIWEWGYLQMVATSLILLQIGDTALGEEMLSIADAWCE